MATASPSSVLHYVHQLIPRERGDCTDRQLLHDFVSNQDQSAFTALVRRHGPLVLSVCQRSLQHTQDTEDAFQAVFIVLAQQAATIRKCDSLASWLYGVSTRIALRARRDLARRRKHEQCVPPRTTLPQGWEMAWKEVQAVLDEELSQLSAIYRDVFILCCLQGMSKAEAAEQLQIKEGTVSSRLDAARKKLRDRLSRRGISLAALMTAVAVTPAEGAVAPELLIRTVGTALIAPSRATMAFALAEGMKRTMIYSRSKMAAVLLLVITLIAGGAIAAIKKPVQSGSLRSQPVSTEEKPKAKLVHVTGRVLSPKGKPVAKAKLYSPRLSKKPPLNPNNLDFVQRGTTDKDGKFSIQIPPDDFSFTPTVDLIAIAPGYAFQWEKIPLNRARYRADLHLAEEQVVEGRVLSTEGKPLPGVSVSAQGVYLPATGKNLDAFLSAWKQEHERANVHTPRRIYVPLEKVLGIRKTDQRGRFLIRGLPREAVVNVVLSGDQMAQMSFNVVTRSNFDPVPCNKAAQNRRLPGQLPHLTLLYGPKAELVASPMREIVGTVKESGTGKPLAGIQVWASAGNGTVLAKTDAKGRYHLKGLPRLNEHLVHVNPPAGSEYLMSGKRIHPEGATGPLKADLVLAKGVVLKGKVVDKATGKGVECGLRFIPLPDNKYFDKPGYDSYRTERLMRRTEANGSFRLVVMPGSGILVGQVSYQLKLPGLKLNPYRLAKLTPSDFKKLKATADDEGRAYFSTAGGSIEFLRLQHTYKILNLRPEAGEVNHRLTVDQGKKVPVEILDDHGKPLSGAMVAGLTESWPMVHRLPTAKGYIYALDPKEPRRVLFYHPEKKLAQTHVLRGDEKGAIQVRLEPSASMKGMLTDQEGEPLVDAEVRVYSRNEIGRELYRQLRLNRAPARTDAKGQFRVEGLIPNMKIGVSIRKGRESRVGVPRIGLRTIGSGETEDLGTVKTKPR